LFTLFEKVNNGTKRKTDFKGRKGALMSRELLARKK